MQLYSGTWTSFYLDATLSQITDQLCDAFRRHFGHDPSPSEAASWGASLVTVANVGQYARLSEHLSVIVEYGLPLSSKRLDVMLLGHDSESRPSALVIELKQWKKCKEADGDNQVSTVLGGRMREVNHPSEQVRGYVEYLLDLHSAFQGADAIRLWGCSYLHNYKVADDDVLVAPKFTQLIESYPLFGNKDYGSLAAFLSKTIGVGNGMEVLSKVREGKYRPARKLLDHVADVIDGKSAYILIDEQRVVYDKIRALVRNGLKRKRKQIVIVEGGPGTGKSVIALNLLGDLSRKGRSAHYATGSKSFTETLRQIVGKRAAKLFSYFNSFMRSPIDALDVLICDEAHRIRSSSNNRFTRKDSRSERRQIEELLNACKVLVLFIDDRQIVRPNEIGSVQYVRDFVATRSDVDLHTYELKVQFRCGGSEAFIDWVNNTLGIVETTTTMLEPTSEFDFRICATPGEMEDLIRDRAEEGSTARMMAGFCWPWSKPTLDGDLVEDVVIDNWKHPWNARPEAGRLKSGIPSASLWAYDKAGIDQVGCIYSAQGFEFDYAGVIIGPDLTYDFDTESWKGDPSKSRDTALRSTKESYLEYAKNLYRVLLTRGMKGCYVYFVDKETERFVRGRVKPQE